MKIFTSVMKTLILSFGSKLIFNLCKDIKNE